MKKPFQNGGTFIKLFQIFKERYFENDIVSLENWLQQNKAGKIWTVEVLLLFRTRCPEPPVCLANIKLYFIWDPLVCPNQFIKIILTP